MVTIRFSAFSKYLKLIASSFFIFINLFLIFLCFCFILGGQTKLDHPSINSQNVQSDVLNKLLNTEIHQLTSEQVSVSFAKKKINFLLRHVR